MTDQPTTPPSPATHLIDDPTATGFYQRDIGDGVRLYVVQWNRAHSARYARELCRPQPTPSQPDVEVHLAYRGQEPLHQLTATDRVSSTFVLRTVAQHAPYDTCMWCHRPLTEPLTQHFGMGQHCATKHLHLPRKVLEVLFRHTPPTGPGSPRALPDDAGPSTAPRRGHLRLVAVNGELVAA